MNVRRHWPIVVPFAFALAAFHAWFVPGLLLGDDQFRFSSQQLASYFPWRNAWDPSFVFGISSGFSSPAYPLWAFAGALARLGLDYAAIERLVWFWPLFACLVIAPYAFVYRLTRAPWAASVGAAAFAMNTWTISLVQRGHIPSLVAYAVTPFVALAWLTLLRKRRPVDAVTFAALLTMQVIYDLRYAYITAIACLIIGAFAAARALARRRFAPAPAVLKSALWTVVALLAFNAYWLIPQFAAPAHLPAGYDTLADFLNGSQSQSLASALALFYPFYHYVQGTDPFAPSAVEPAFFIVFALVIVASISVCRRWIAGSFVAAALVGIVLTSGPNSPFGSFDGFAFAHVPGMTLFRDISKFSALVGFAYATLLALGFARLVAALRAGAGKNVARRLAAVLACIGVAAYAWLLHDAFNPMRLSNFATTALSHDDQAMQAFVDRQPGYFRTVLFPTWRPELVGTATHPVVSADYLVDSAASDGGLSEFFPPYTTLLERFGSPLLPKLLAEGSVRYLVVDDDPKGVLYKPFAYNITHGDSVAYFRARPWLHEVARFGGYVVFELTPASAPRAFFAQSPVMVNGSPPSLAAVVGTPAWSGLPAVVIPPVPFDYATRRTFVSDSASGAETVTADFSTAYGEQMRAWVGAVPFAIGPAPSARVRMRRVDTLTPAVLPDYPILPSRPVTVEVVDPRILSAPYPDPHAGAHWRGIVGPSAEIELTNWSGSAVSVDFTIPAAFAPDSRERVVRVTAGNVTQSFVVSGELFGYSPHRAIVVRGLVLEPGLNVVHLDVGTRGFGGELPAPANAYSLIFADDLAVSVQSGDASIIRHKPHSAVESRASFALFPSLAISLARDPKLSVTDELPPGAARFAIYAELRSRDDGMRFEFIHALPTSLTNDTVDLVTAVQAALDADRTATPATRLPDDADVFDLVAVRLVIVGSNQTDVATELRAAAHGAHIVDARVDIPQAQGDSISTVSNVDMRGATIAAAGARSKLQRRLAHVQAATGRTLSSANVSVPVRNDNAAAQLVFWSRSSPEAAPTVDLSFTSQDDGRIVTVPAAAYSAASDLAAHVVNGQAAPWRRSIIDLGELKADLFPAGGARYALTGIRITAGAQGPLGSFDISDLALVSATPASAHTASGPPSQSLFVDGRVVPLQAWRQDPLTFRYVGESAPFSVGPGHHRLSVEPALPLQPTSIYTVSSTLTKVAGNVRGFTTLSPSEYVTDVDYGGLLVWPMSFAPGWQAFRIPASDAGSTPTGFALFDAWRFRADRVPDSYHYAVNCAFNGWFVAPGAARVVLLYVPEAASEFAALVWLVLSAAVVIAAVALPRARP